MKQVIYQRDGFDQIDIVFSFEVSNWSRETREKRTKELDMVAKSIRSTASIGIDFPPFPAKL